MKEGPHLDILGAVSELQRSRGNSKLFQREQNILPGRHESQAYLRRLFRHNECWRMVDQTSKSQGKVSTHSQTSSERQGQINVPLDPQGVYTISCVNEDSGKLPGNQDRRVSQVLCCNKNLWGCRHGQSFVLQRFLLTHVANEPQFSPTQDDNVPQGGSSES